MSTLTRTATHTTPIPRARSRPLTAGAEPAARPDASDLLSRARRGDQAAWRALVRSYHGLILATCRRLGLPPASCEDVAQTTWLRLFQHVDELRDDGALPAWLITTSRREALTTLRRERRTVLSDEATLDVRPDADQADVADPEHQMVVGVVGHQVRAALRTLSERDRRLLTVLFHPAQLSYEQVAELLQMPVGSIGPLRQRALRRLRQRLEHLDPRQAVA